MLNKFNNLAEDERQELFDAIPVITLLIAGADGKIDEDELQKSKDITRIRGFAGGEDMQAFYDEVGKNYANTLDRWMKVIPQETAERTTLLSDRLGKLNEILAKLDQETAAHLYKSYTSFAEHIAKADGGFLGFGSINKAESKLIDLPMLTPIALPDNEEEE